MAGVTRQLPIMQVSPTPGHRQLRHLGDCEIVTQAAPLIKAAARGGYIVTAEAKGIPLVNELCRLRGPALHRCRKSIKP